jgi:prophage regulatory protein
MNENAPESHPPGGLTCLRMAEVRRKTGLGETCIRKAIAEGTFPAPFKIGARAVGWLESDIDRWITDRAARRVMFKA